MTGYISKIPHRVHGIPCLIGVKYFHSVSGSYSRTADSDMDYYGYVDCDWDVLDQRGRPAAWLDRKLTNRNRDEITGHIADQMEDLK